MRNNKITNKKKIGIITFHRAINYGALLQTYALHKKIKDLGFDNEILDYRNQVLEKKHKKMKLSISNGIKGILKYLLIARNHNTKHNKFREFTKKYIKMSEPLNSLDDIKKIESQYSKFITGSDQVWNYNITNFDKTYFLQFTRNNSKKNAYAASFGISKIPNDLVNDYKNLLKGFNIISIREEKGAEIIRNLINKDVDTVLDPTMLIDKNQWFKLADDKLYKNEKFILIYGFGGSSNIINFAKNLSKKTGYKIVHITSSFKKIKGVIYEQSVGPEEFLGLFKNAEFIITNSFHGTAFSINFNKQFFIELLPASTGVNSRLEHILNLFDLNDRLITSTVVNNYKEQIDYTYVNKILTKEKEKSIKILKKILQD